MAGCQNRAPSLPQPVLAPTAAAANLLTVVSMAALGLEVDVRVVARAGGRVMTVVTASLGPTWGYHIDDINLALGDLVSDVSALEGAPRQ